MAQTPRAMLGCAHSHAQLQGTASVPQNLAPGDRRHQPSALLCWLQVFMWESHRGIG